MANNRIYLRCNGCGKTLFLGKTYWGGYYWENLGAPLERTLNDFYDEHTYCGDAWGDGDFSIQYEFPLDDGEAKYIRVEDVGKENPSQFTLKEMRPQGNWFKHEKAGYYSCSQCGSELSDAEGFEFCPNCGARMRSVIRAVER